MRKAALALVIGAASLVGSVAHAETPFYVGIEGTQSHFSDDALSRENSTGVKLYGGYNINSRFAVEGEVGASNGYRVVTGNHASVTDAAVSLKVSQPLGHGLTAFGKMGVAYQDLDVHSFGSTNGFNPVFGAGVEYGLTKKVSLRLEDELTPRIADVHDVYNSVNFGIGYRF
jgi:opacity protein-like surface antigen